MDDQGSEIKTLYLAERERLSQQETESYRDFDRLVLALAGGTLGLSIAFLKDIVGTKPAENRLLLPCGWGALIIAIAASLISIWLAAYAASAFRDALDDTAASHGFVEDYWTHARKAQESSRLPVLIHVCNIVSVVATLVGMFLIALFAFSNI